MQRFKRNQINEALEAILSDNVDAGLGADVKTRIRRLLEIDRWLTESDGRRRYAFYSKDSPGSGSEVGYSPYETFALLAGLCFLQLGWPQQTVVRVMRLVRPVLEIEHARIRGGTANQTATRSPAAKVRRPPGISVLASNDPVFLAIFASGRTSADRSSLATHSVTIRRSERDLMSFWKEQTGIGLTSMTNIEITHLVYALEDQLGRRPPRARGRKAK